MKDMTVLVTGGSRGIGRATVECLCREGARVAFTYRSSEGEARELAARTGALPIRADNASEEDIARAVRETVATLGPIDCLVNNAGISHVSLLTDMSTDEMRRILDVHLLGAMLYCREVLPSMVRRRFGRIINISSMWGLTGGSCEVVYSAAKAGLIGLTRALSKEVGPSGITVNAIAPGVIDTEMNAALTEEDRRALCDETPLGRIGRPEEIAQAVRFLASEEAAFMTGAVLNVSGGFVV